VPHLRRPDLMYNVFVGSIILYAHIGNLAGGLLSGKSARSLAQPA
jgi:hypothetical protein